MTRGQKAADLARINRLMDLANELGTEFVATCDWGHKDGTWPAVGYRKNGSDWLAVCETHAIADPKRMRR